MQVLAGLHGIRCVNKCECTLAPPGWHYKHWVGSSSYPTGLPASRMFDYYQRFFNTVELNNKFYC